MRWELLALALLLAPPLAAAHGSEPHGNGTHPEGSGEPPRPGAWPPTADNATSASEDREASRETPGTAGAYEATVSSPGTREWRGFKADALRTGATSARPPVAPSSRPMWEAGERGSAGFLAPPVVAHGLAVAAALDGAVRAFDVGTGFEQWVAEAPGRVLAAPAVADDAVVVAAADGTVLALDLRSGMERWRAQLPAVVSGAPLFLQGVVYLASESGRVVALDAATGAERWNRTLRPLDSLVAPMWTAGRLIVGDRLGQVHALHALTGQTLWTSDVGSPVTATPVGAGGKIVVPTLGLKALDAETGRVAWARATGAFVRSSPAFRAGVLVLGDPDQQGVLGLNAANGEPLWTSPTRLYVRAPPAIAGDLAIAGIEDGHLFAFQLRNGSLVWTLDLGEAVHAPPILLDGRVLIARMDGAVRLYGDAATQASLDPEVPVGATGTNQGLVGLLPIFAALGGPYLALKWGRDRMHRRVAEEERRAAGVKPFAAVPSAPRTTARVACPRCACRFGVEPRHLGVVRCPACGAASLVRRRERAAEGGGDAVPGE